MKLIRLLEHDIEVYFDAPNAWSLDGVGRCDIKNGCIRIRASMPSDVVASTLLHEVVHMISDLLTIEQSEQSVDNMAIGILSFIRNNREFIEEFIYKDP